MSTLFSLRLSSLFLITSNIYTYNLFFSNSDSLLLYNLYRIRSFLAFEKLWKKSVGLVFWSSYFWCLYYNTWYGILSFYWLKNRNKYFWIHEISGHLQVWTRRKLVWKIQNQENSGSWSLYPASIEQAKAQSLIKKLKSIDSNVGGRKQSFWKIRVIFEIQSDKGLLQNVFLIKVKLGQVFVRRDP